MKELTEVAYQWIGYVGILGIVVALGLLIGYAIQLSLRSTPAEKYRFAGTYEIRTLKFASMLFSVSLGFFLFDLLTRVIGLVESYEFYFIGFVSLGIAFMVGYGLYTYFKVYYPFVLEKKLSRIRFQLRISPKTGKPMRLLNELEEDAHLTQQMIDDELAFTYDYDVWLDEETGYKLIEQFEGHFQALICPHCHFRTMKDYKEVVVKSPDFSSRGVLAKHYKCSYCEYEEVKEIPIVSLREEQELQVI